MFNPKFNLTQYLFENYSDPKKILYYTNRDNYTLDELIALTTDYTHLLQLKGAKAQDRIIISLNDNIDLIALFFAAISLGIIPIVINPYLHEKQFKFILADSGATLHLYQNGKDIWLQNKVSNIAISDLMRHIKREPISYYYTSSDSLAFIQYTSGTTGNPKGVMHSADNVLEICEKFAKACLNLTEHDIIYSTSKMFFGYGMGNSIFFPLYLGASAILDESWPKVNKVLHNIETFKPTILFSVPALYQELLSFVESQDLKNIKIFFSAGSLLPKQLIADWYQMFKSSIYNGIGCTELLHVFVTNFKRKNALDSLGTALPGFNIKLLSQFKESVAPHYQGELYVSGPSVFLGYWNNKSATKQKLQNGWYRTHDLCRLDAEGQLHYEGRADDLFKVNGRWVNPLLVEKFIKNRFKKISNAFLIPIKNNNKTATALLFSTNVDEAKMALLIKEEIATHFEKHILPISYIPIKSSEVPVNSNGKIVRKHLNQLLPTTLEFK